LDEKLNKLFLSKDFGNAVYVERFLSGQEITVTVMPPGNYFINNTEKKYKKPWCLPAIKRFNHKDVIAP
jgi:phosphoribosylamine-glycine ligase